MIVTIKERTIEYLLDKGSFERGDYAGKERMIVGYLVDRYNLFDNPRRKREIISMEKDFIEEYVRMGTWNPALATCMCDTEDKEVFIGAFSSFLFHTSYEEEYINEDGDLDGESIIDDSVLAYFKYLYCIDVEEHYSKKLWGSNWREDARATIASTEQIKREV